MKHCEKCHNTIKDNTAFCPRCGTKQRYAQDQCSRIDYNHFNKYAGLSIKGVYANVMEITPQGVHIYRTKSLFYEKYDKLIPYKNIQGIRYCKATIASAGYLSILTNDAGVYSLTPPFLPKETLILSTDQNTITYQFNNRKLVAAIYEAVNELCAPENTAFEYGCLNKNSTSVYKNQENDIFSIDGMDGHQFEYFCADLLQKNGFSEVSVTPGSGDQGVDILATKDEIKYAVQCKNYASALGNTPVQEVNAGKTFYGCHVGIVMTNSIFTPGAKKLAEATGVLLWDRAYVEKLMENAGITNWIDEQSDCTDGCVEGDNTNLRNTMLAPSDIENNGETDNSIDKTNKLSRTPRKWLLILAIIFFVPTVLVLISSIVNSAILSITESLFMYPMVILFGTPGVLFLVFSFSPKENIHILGKPKGIKKKHFIFLCIGIMILAFVLIGILASVFNNI